MSFKLLLASTFGFVKSTAKIEAAYEALLAEYYMFCEFEKSSEKKEYHELEVLVNSATFKQQKKALQQLALKGSKEEAQLKELKTLSRNRRLLKFYDTLKSEELKRFEKVTVSEWFGRYKNLKSIVESQSFDSKKKKDVKSDEFLQFEEYHKLKSSGEVTFYEHFSKSSAYKIYLELKNSHERKRFDELQQLTSSDEFKNRIVYLEDKQKWEKTEDAIKEKRFVELQKLPQFINYQKYKGSNAFDFFRKWNLVFEDRFDSGKLDSQKWMTQSHWGNQALGQNFSQPGDLHAFTDGKNVSVDGKILKIEVRREKTKGMQWQIPFGFVEREFDYSSGLVSTAGVEWWKHGILEAKVKYSPSSNFVDAIYLLGEESSPQVNLVELGAKTRLGLLRKSNDGIHSECESIAGLKTGEYYIFRLEWSAHSLVWKVNEREMLTLTHNIPAFKMHLNIASILVSEQNEGLPHRFEIDWVRFYQHTKE